MDFTMSNNPHYVRTNYDESIWFEYGFEETEQIVQNNAGVWVSVNPEIILANVFTERGMMFSYQKPDGTPDYCWTWMGRYDNRGMPIAYVDGNIMNAARYAYLCFNGPIPPGKIVTHRSACGKSCCNPEHLKLVNYGQNPQLDDSFTSDGYPSSDYYLMPIINKRTGTFYKNIPKPKDGEPYWQGRYELCLGERAASRFSGIRRGTIKKYTDPTTRIFRWEAYQYAKKLHRLYWLSGRER